MNRLTFLIEDKFLDLAQEWLGIEERIVPLHSKSLSQKECFYMVEARAKAWKNFLKEHKLMKREKPLKVLGLKEEMWSVKHKEELDRAIILLRIAKAEGNEGQDGN